MRCDDDRTPGGGQHLDPVREVALGAAVHPAGRLVEADDRRTILAIAENDGECESLPLAPGEVARMTCAMRAEPDQVQGSRRRLLPNRVVQHVVARVLKQQRDATGGLDAPSRRLQQPGRVAQQGRLAGSVSAHERNALTRSDGQVDGPEDRAPTGKLMPDVVELQHRLRRGRAPAQQAASNVCGRLPGGHRGRPVLVEQAVRTQGRTGLLDARGWRP